MVSERLLLVRAKLREGMDRLASENPDLDFSVDTPATEEAERYFDHTADMYSQGLCGLSDLKKAFDGWADAQINKSKEQMLF